jgi:hypothetical protein
MFEDLKGNNAFIRREIFFQSVELYFCGVAVKRSGCVMGIQNGSPWYMKVVHICKYIFIHCAIVGQIGGCCLLWDNEMTWTVGILPPLIPPKRFAYLPPSLSPVLTDYMVNNKIKYSDKGEKGHFVKNTHNLGRVDYKLHTILHFAEHTVEITIISYYSDE